MESCPHCGHPYGKRRRCYFCNGRPRTGQSKSCQHCGETFYVQLNQLKRGEGRFCSYECKYQADRGKERRPGGRYITSAGYVAVKVGIRHYELEHRLVAAEALGRSLATDEHVHHINGDKQDNRPENLLVVTNEEHQRIHDFPQTKPRRIEKTCEQCGASYLVKASKSGSRFCSNVCRLVALHAGNRKKE